MGGGAVVMAVWYTGRCSPEPVPVVFHRHRSTVATENCPPVEATPDIRYSLAAVSGVGNVHVVVGLGTVPGKPWAGRLLRLTQGDRVRTAGFVPDRGGQSRFPAECLLGGEPVSVSSPRGLGGHLQALQAPLARRHGQHPQAVGAVRSRRQGRGEIGLVGTDPVLPGVRLLAGAGRCHRRPVGLDEEAQESFFAGEAVGVAEGEVGVRHDGDAALTPVGIGDGHEGGVGLAQDPVVHPFGERPADRVGGRAEGDEDVAQHDLVVEQRPRHVVVAGLPLDVLAPVTQLVNEQITSRGCQAKEGRLAPFSAQGGPLHADQIAGGDQVTQAAAALGAHDVARGREEERGDLIGGKKPVARNGINDLDVALRKTGSPLQGRASTSRRCRCRSR